MKGAGTPEFRRKQVKAARALLGWTQAKLAAKAKVSTPTVVNYERGKFNSFKAGDIFQALEAAGAKFTPLGVELRSKPKERKPIIH